jgi:hypothetical protein
MVARGEVVVGLTKVWLQTAADGLVRADQVTGIGAHQTPELSGKPSRWLLDVVMPVSTGNVTREDWGITVLHRTLIQTSDDPGDAPAELARLLAQLDITAAAGVITTSREGRDEVRGPASAGRRTPRRPARRPPVIRPARRTPARPARPPLTGLTAWALARMRQERSLQGAGQPRPRRPWW